MEANREARNIPESLDADFARKSEVQSILLAATQSMDAVNAQLKTLATNDQGLMFEDARLKLPPDVEHVQKPDSENVRESETWMVGESRYFVAVLLVTQLLLTACASNKVSDLYEFYKIESNNESKLFGYRFVLDPSQRQAGTSARRLPKRAVVSFDEMRGELKKYMGAQPYCTEGYFVYDENFDGQKYTLFGECQESK